MIIKLPLSADPAQTFTIQLDDTKYQFDVRWNDRSAVWTTDISRDDTGAVVISGLPLVLGADLLLPYNLGIGHLLAVDENGTETDATETDLGTRVNVYWISADEVT